MGTVVDLLEGVAHTALRLLRNASGWEILWTVVAVVGIVLSARASSRAYSLWIATKHDEHPEPILIRRAFKRVRDALGAFCRCTGYATIGIISMQLPSAEPMPGDVAPGLVVAIIFVGFEVYDVAMLWLDQRDWDRTATDVRRDPTVLLRLVEGEAGQRLVEATRTGRDMGHLVRNQFQRAYGLQEEILADPATGLGCRERAQETLTILTEVMNQVASMHAEIQKLSPEAGRPLPPPPGSNPNEELPG